MPEPVDAAQARMDDMAADRFMRWLDRVAPLPDTHEEGPSNG